MAPFFSALHRLAVDYSGCWFFVPTRFYAYLAAEHLIDALEHSFVSPLGEVHVHYFPGWQVMRQHPPGTPRFGHVEHGIHDFSAVVPGWATSRRALAAASWLRHKMFYPGPFFVFQVCRVRLARFLCFHTYDYTRPLPY